MTAPSTEVARLLAHRTATDANDWHVVLKARYGMAQVFSGIASSSERRSVVTQLLTCSTAVDPILEAGLIPVYADVSPRTYSLDPDRLALSADTAAVVVQHTFGIIDSNAAARIDQAARRVGAVVCEDSAHCAGRMARSEDGTPLADVSFHSFGVEKMLPTKFGGAVWVNPALPAPQREAIIQRLRDVRRPRPRLRFAVRTYRYQLAVLNRLPGPAAATVRRALIALGLFEPAVAAAERAGRLGREPTAITPSAARAVTRKFSQLSQIEQSRAAAVDVYLRELADFVTGATVLSGQPLVRFPILVPPGIDADAVIGRLRTAGIFAGSWYRPALFPGATRPEAYHYRPGDPAVANTEDLIARIVNLPTGVSPERAAVIAAAARNAIG